MEKIKENRGITLVVLVITIVILLILAGITISSLTNTGLFGRAKEARDKTAAAAENQAKILNEYEEIYYPFSTPFYRSADRLLPAIRLLVCLLYREPDERRSDPHGSQPRRI